MPASNKLTLPSKEFAVIDWLLFFSILPILAAGLVTMYSFTEPNVFFEKQLVWIAASLALFFGGSFIDWRFLRRRDILFTLFTGCAFLLLFLFGAGKVVKGAQSWFDFGVISFQPVELSKLVLILLLAKYFSRRHIEIGHLRHIFVSGAYALTLFVLVLLQPDFGGAIVIFCIWFSMVLVSGISRKHLLAVLAAAFLSVVFLWSFVFADYQKQRLVSFVHPLTDIRGAGYNAYQSTIAVGSGRWSGKGIGFGSQSRLQFLPEYETDFIFAAFAEEWGFMGVTILFLLYGILLWRILLNALRGSTNFEVLFGLGLAIFIMSQFFIHVGMNLGLLPVTGITLPFMSYGGSNLAIFFLGLGILMGMRRYRRAAHKEAFQSEFLGAA